MEISSDATGDPNRASAAFHCERPRFGTIQRRAFDCDPPNFERASQTIAPAPDRPVFPGTSREIEPPRCQSQLLDGSFNSSHTDVPSAPTAPAPVRHLIRKSLRLPSRGDTLRLLFALSDVGDRRTGHPGIHRATSCGQVGNPRRYRAPVRISTRNGSSGPSARVVRLAQPPRDQHRGPLASAFADEYSSLRVLVPPTRVGHIVPLDPDLWRRSPNARSRLRARTSAASAKCQRIARVVIQALQRNCACRPRDVLHYGIHRIEFGRSV